MRRSRSCKVDAFKSKIQAHQLIVASTFADRPNRAIP
jgi:hypothetical protein